MSPVIDVEMVIAVHLEPLELQQELLHHGLRLEGDDAVLVPLVATLEDDAVHRLLDLGEKVALFALITDLMHLVYKNKLNCSTRLCSRVSVTDCNNRKYTLRGREVDRVDQGRDQKVFVFIGL